MSKRYTIFWSSLEKMSVVSLDPRDFSWKECLTSYGLIY